MKKINKSKKQSENESIDYIIPIIFILSILVPIIIASSQQYIVQYGDDVVVIGWAKDHSVFDIFTTKLGTGYRPVMNLFYVVGYSLWGNNAAGYYLLDGLFLASGMIFLYLLGKTLHSKLAGIISVGLYLSLDATFILVEKINFLVTTGEIFFITSALYYSIKYINTKDKNSGILAIILSTLAFLTKELSILIIPTVILTYLYCKKQLNKQYILLCVVPFLYLFIVMFFIAPDVGSGNTNIFQRIINNLQFYINTEMDTQFKTPFLLILSFLIATYYYSYNKLKTEISLCFMWIIVGIAPLLITQQPVQPTYLAEMNLGVVLLMGIIISESFKKIDIITVLIIIGILAQISIIPMQISGMQNYNRMISDNQNTFYDSIRELNTIPYNSTAYYIPDNVRQKYGGYQLTEDFFRKYLCLINDCRNTKITTNYTEANYIILPSSLDIQIFQKEYSTEINKLQLIKQIQHGNDYGLILKKV